MLVPHFSATRLRVDFEWAKTFREDLQVQIRQGAREFIREAIKQIPVDTGQARGTFLPLGRYLHTAIPIFDGLHSRSSTRNSVTGRLEGKDQHTGAENHPIIFAFNHGTDFEQIIIVPQLDYFIINDTVNMHYSTGNPTPWRAMESGTKALNLYMTTEGVRKLPRLAKLLTQDSSGLVEV